MPAPDYKEELRHQRFPVDENTRPVAVLYTYDPASNTFGPVTSTGLTGGGQALNTSAIFMAPDAITGVIGPVTSIGVTGVGQVLNTNLVGGVMQVENLHVEMDSTGIHGVTGGQINPSTEETLQDILETLGGAVVAPKQVGQAVFGSADVSGDDLTMTGIVEFEVPAGKRFSVTSLRGWADVDVEFMVTINGVQIDGFRTTPAQLTMNISAALVHYAEPFELVKVWAKHAYVGKTRTVKAVIQGSLELIP